MSGLLSIEPKAFVDAFPHRSTNVRHALSQHPLLSLQAIAELADALPANSVRIHRADLPVVIQGKLPEIDRDSPSETVLGIEGNGCRVALRDIQQVPEYAALINECLDEVAIHVSDRQGGMRSRAGYLFISAPASTTPMHYDAEHNLLLQIIGQKKASVSFFSDPEIQRREIDRYFDGHEPDFRAMTDAADNYELLPDDGVYIPSFVPHWVETEEGVSVSFSIPFYTQFVERVESVMYVNRRMRHLRLRPRPPGESERVDRAKAGLARAWAGVRRAGNRVRGRSEPQLIRAPSPGDRRAASR